MRWIFVGIGLTAAAIITTSGTAGAAPPKHFLQGEQWTLELQTAPGPEGACAIETVGPNNTLTFDLGQLGNGTYHGGGKYLKEFFTAQDGNNFTFHGSWSPTTSEYGGKWRVRGRSGFLADGSYPGQVVSGAVGSWGGSNC
jgi:hypothetical protein